MPVELNSLLQNRYRVISELGHGGMGAVYFGHDDNLGVEVAIKENKFVSPESERHFKREATLLASLRHPNLPRVTDHFVVPGQGQYLVMDFVPGDDLRHRLDQAGGPLPEADVVHWAGEILSALQYLHTLEPPIVHRDIKPGNIKITPEGRAVLVDFGLAKPHDLKLQTTTGAKALTPGFAPPEQYGVGRTDPRTDIYSFAATLYNLLTHHVPDDALERAIGNRKLTPVRDLNPRVSQAVAEAVEHGLGVKPDERFASAAEFRAALIPPAGETIQAGDKTRVGPMPRGRAAAPRRSRLPLVGLAAVGLIVMAVGAWYFLFNGQGGALTTPTPRATRTVGPAGKPTLTAPAPATEAPGTTEAPTAGPTVVPTTAPSPQPQGTPLGGGAHGQIAFASERTGRPQIFLMNADGSGVTQLTDIPDGACQPAWSPDGMKLLFVSPCAHKTDAYPRSTIYSLDLANPTAAPNAFVIMLGGAYDPVWTAAGLAFTGLESNRAHIYLADANGSGAKLISGRLAVDNQPTLSPDGERIAYRNTSNAGTPLIFWMYKDGTFEGTRPNQVTRVDSHSPAWSPRGDVVAYVAGAQIFVVGWDAKGFNEIQPAQAGPNDDPAWSPDGDWIVFESWRDNSNHDIYLMTASGSRQTRLTDDPAWDYQPAWRP